ncbi:hypothetical protein [uncultured Bilophila sp.]|uniref:hypothetical protein n=1 Tax=uncultured Bilophila sp. TaxID=529385 RepID=UPI00280C2C49|nr:hypothetical protein [uncultured Bilophila sp.]
MKKFYLLGLMLVLPLNGYAYYSNRQEGPYNTAEGAATEDILGQIIGGNTKSTLIDTATGVVVEGLAGAGVGTMINRQKKDMASLTQPQSIAVQREENMLILTLKKTLHSM